jgi:hypothetical protein
MIRRSPIWLVASFFILKSAHSQTYPDSTSIDSLNKYSYLLLGLSDITPFSIQLKRYTQFDHLPYNIEAFGTGFFIKKNKKLFFVLCH